MPGHVFTLGWTLCFTGVVIYAWFYLAARFCKFLTARCREGNGTRSAYVAFLACSLMGLAAVAAFWLSVAWRLIEGFLRVRP